MCQQFDLVLIRPEYAPEHRRSELVDHVLNQVLKPNGRLIVFVGTEEADVRGVEATIIEGGLSGHGRVEIPHSKDSRLVRRLFWIDNEGV